jgi:hypothetical protein
VVCAAAAEAWRGWRGAAGRADAGAEAPRFAAILDALLVAAPALAFTLRSIGRAPAGDPGAWLLALPFLALGGACAISEAGHHLWPGAASRTTAALAVLALAPGARATVHAWPRGGTAWAEQVGGAPGATSRGLRRQVSGDALFPVLAALAEHASPGARVWFPEEVRVAAAAAVGTRPSWRRAIALAERPEEADIAVWQLDGRSRDGEYLLWTRFRSARPVMAVHQDEVPLAHVYAQPGAWR